MTQAIWNDTVTADTASTSVVEGNRAAAWQYRDPRPAADNVKGHVAFGVGVKVKRTPPEGRDATTNAPGLLRRMFCVGASR